MMPIRVLQVFASLDRGGAETMMMNIYRNIDRNKIQFDFIVNDRSEIYSYELEIESLGGRIIKLPKFKGINYFSYKKTWSELLSQHPEWKIIHGHHTSTAFIYLLVANSLNRKSIAHSHTSGGEKTVKSYVKFFTRYPLKYIADSLFACSQSAADWMFGNKSNQAHILKNAIDAKQFIFNETIRYKKRKEFQIDDKFVIGHIGRFQTQKNHSFIIDIFKEIYEQNQNTVLMLVGDGELRPTIEKKVNNLGLTDHVIFTGVRSDIPELLQAMDVFLFPSLYEGLPVTLVEAQAAGLRCIISDTITDEVIITDLVEQLSLDLSAKHWSEEVIKYTNGYERKNTFEEIKANGYDIKDTAKWLEDFYLKKLNFNN